MKRQFIFLLCFLTWHLFLPFFAKAENKTIILATTTSTDDTGLLDALIPIFQKESGYFVKTVAVGSGMALLLGKRGEADVLLVHSPEEEERFMSDGYGVKRHLVMHNDFIIVGPKNDPAGIRSARNSVAALQQIANKKMLFISRGDNSGTHIKELKIWRQANINPVGQKWYQETGLGMGQTLSVANEKNGYTLADRGTYLSLRKNISLQILKEGDGALLNVYHVIELNPKLFPVVNIKGGKAFADFIVSKKAQEIIRQFGIDKFGSPLFSADADKKESELGAKWNY